MIDNDFLSVSRKLLERVATEADHVLGFTYAANYDECRSAVDELRAILDAPPEPSPIAGLMAFVEGMERPRQIRFPDLPAAPKEDAAYRGHQWADEEIDEITVDRGETARRVLLVGGRRSVKTFLAAQLESLAKQVYQSWESQPGFVPWVEGGNSHKQEDARRIASRTFELALANQVGGGE